MLTGASSEVVDELTGEEHVLLLGGRYDDRELRPCLARGMGEAIAPAWREVMVLRMLRT
jgi:hypothetical protein